MTVYTTWEISIDKIKSIAEGSSSRFTKEAAQGALELLQIFCFWHFDGILEEMFRKAGKNTHRENLFGGMTQPRVLVVDDHGQWNAYPFRQAINLLSSFSLISIDGEDNVISIHPLVHTWARDRLAEEERLSFWRIAVMTLSASFRSGRTSSEYKLRRLRLPHINSCLRIYHYRELFTDDMQLQGAHAADFFAGVYYEWAHYKESMELMEQIVKSRETVLGDENLSTLRARRNLAMSYMEVPDRHPDALRLLEHVLEVETRILGPENKYTLRTMHSLAIGYNVVNRKEDAMKLHEQGLKTRKRILGDEHVHTLYSMHSLAILYSDLGRHDDALVLTQHVLDTRKRVLGDEHPATLRAMGSTARIYAHLGRREDAIKLGQLALEISKRVLGDEHPDILLYIEVLAYCLSNDSNGSFKDNRLGTDNARKPPRRLRKWFDRLIL